MMRRTLSRMKPAVAMLVGSGFVAWQSTMALTVVFADERKETSDVLASYTSMAKSKGWQTRNQDYWLYFYKLMRWFFGFVVLCVLVGWKLGMNVRAQGVLGSIIGILIYNQLGMDYKPLEQLWNEKDQSWKNDIVATTMRRREAAQERARELEFQQALTAHGVKF